MADPTAIYGGYLKASRYGRIKDADLSRVLKPYRISLSTLRSRRYQGVTDSALRSLASRVVVRRYQERRG